MTAGTRLSLVPADVDVAAVLLGHDARAKREREEKKRCIGGDEHKVLARICEFPYELIEERFEALNLERAREYRARKRLQGLGMVELGDKVGKLQLWVPTQKGIEWARGLDLPVHRYKSGIAHEFMLRNVRRELERALATARDLRTFLVDHWGASQEALFPFFSGRRGFHLGVHCGVFGEVQPGERLPDVFHRVLRSVVAQARPRYRDTVDYTVGRRLSLIRLPNTEHSGSGLYKTPLSVSELMRCTPGQIRRLARSEREIDFTDPTGLLPLYEVAAVPHAAELYDKSVGEVTQRLKEDLPPPESFLGGRNLAEVLCDAELALYREGVPNGARSRTALRLASRMRCAEYGEKAVVDRLLDWNERNEPPMEGQEVERIGRCAFSVGVPYQSGCGTGGDGDSADTRLIYEACPYTNRLECRTYRAFQAERHRANGRE